MRQTDTILNSVLEPFGLTCGCRGPKIHSLIWGLESTYMLFEKIFPFTLKCWCLCEAGWLGTLVLLHSKNRLLEIIRSASGMAAHQHLCLASWHPQGCGTEVFPSRLLKAQASLTLQSKKLPCSRRDFCREMREINHGTRAARINIPVPNHIAIL